jgi:protein TonB
VPKLLIFLMVAICLTQAEDTARKIKSRVAPQYPELARKMNVTGVVKLQVLIAQNGEVKSVKPMGGHPLLIDSASRAVKQWRFEPGSDDTEIIEVKFNNSTQ